MKGGGLTTESTGGRRALFAVLSCGALIGLPLTLLGGPTGGAVGDPVAGRHTTAATPQTSKVTSEDWALARATVEAPGSTPPAPAPTTTTTTAPAPAPTTTTTAAPAPTTTTTTTTDPPPPPTTTTTEAAPQVLSSSETGQATWYSAAPAGYCASPWLPFGTSVQVVNDVSGASTDCVVDDREAAGPPRIIDMSPSGFAQIADPSQGVATVTISW